MSELRPIPDFDDYEISADGCVWSKPRDGRGGLWLKPDPHGQGYFRVTLVRSNETFRFLVHRLVALAWIGPPPFDGAKVLHRNDDRGNNHYTNLYYGTQSQNMSDAVKNGKITNIQNIYGVSKGEANGNSKLTIDQVREIKLRLSGGESMRSIANDYPVGPGSISQIKHGETWKDV